MKSPAPLSPGIAMMDSPCPACESLRCRVLFHATDRLYHTTDRVFRVVECAECRLIRLDPWPEPAELRGYYPPSYWAAPGKSFSDWAETAYRRFVLGDHVRFVRRALENSGHPGPVLDVGCGGGLFLRLLAETGIPVVGLDFSLDAAVVAWRGNRVPAVCASLGKSPIPPRSCAVVTMFHVIEHLYNPASYIDAAHELLLPEGRLVVQVPNAACWQFLLFGEHWNGVDVPRHLINYKEQDLVALVESAGFDVVRTKHFSLRDNPAGLATTLAPSLDPMARRVRPGGEAPRARLLQDLLYFALVAASVPFTLVEAACRAGSTIMLEARKRT